MKLRNFLGNKKSREAAVEGRINDLIVREKIGLREAQYLSATCFQPYNGTVETELPSNDESLQRFRDWRNILIYSWHQLAGFSTTSSVDELASRCAASKYSPEDLRFAPICNFGKILSLSKGDSAIVFASMKWYIRHQLGKKLVASEFIDRQPVISNINFLKPHAQRHDFMTTNIATNGLIGTVTAENYFHSAMIIPITLFLSAALGNYETRLSEDSQEILINTSIALNILFYTSMISSLMVSLVALVSSQPSRMTDYEAARYLAIKWWIRYFDFICFFFGIAIVLPTQQSFLLLTRENKFLFGWHIMVTVLTGLIIFIYTILNFFYERSTFNIAVGKRRWFRFIASSEKVSWFLEAGGHYRKREAASNWEENISEALASNFFPPVGDDDVPDPTKRLKKKKKRDGLMFCPICASGGFRGKDESGDTSTGSRAMGANWEKGEKRENGESRGVSEPESTHTGIPRRKHEFKSH